MIGKLLIILLVLVLLAILMGGLALIFNVWKPKSYDGSQIEMTTIKKSIVATIILSVVIFFIDLVLDSNHPLLIRLRNQKKNFQ